jgi:hypothetical protein
MFTGFLSVVNLHCFNADPNPDPQPAFYANADPHTEQVHRFMIRFRIQGFDDHKAKTIKNLQLKKLLNKFFIQNCNLLITRQYSMSKLQPSALKENIQQFISSRFLFYWVALLDPDPHSRCGSGSSRPISMRIRIRNTWVADFT